MPSLNKFVFQALDVFFDSAHNSGITRKCNKSRGVDVTVINHVNYSDRTVDCTADLYYYPMLQNYEKYPVMIYIHGGGFVAGDKKYRRALSAWYARLGFFVMNINYSLGNDLKFPTQVLECVDALNYVAEIADNYNLDTDKIFIAGDSAGAYYSAMVGCIASNSELQNKFNVIAKVKPTGLILNCGLYDLELALNKQFAFNLCDLTCLDYTGYHVKDIKSSDIYSILSPAPLIHSNFPECFIIYAKHDVFCDGQSECLIKQLEENNIKYKLYFSEKPTDNHCFSLSWQTKSSKEVMNLIDDYLKLKLKE